MVRKKKIAMNNFRLNSIISLMLFILELLPFYFPWYSEPYQILDATGKYIIAKDPEEQILFSLFSVFVNDRWMLLVYFIADHCPKTRKKDEICQEYLRIEYASFGVTFIHI